MANVNQGLFGLSYYFFLVLIFCKFLIGLLILIAGGEAAEYLS